MGTLFAPVSVHREDGPDGSVLVRSTTPLDAYPATLVDAFEAGRAAHPDRILVADRLDGDWRRLTWDEAGAQADAVAAWLTSVGAAGRPVMVLSGNSIEHLVLTLACYRAGSPVAPVSVAYSLQSQDHAKLRRMAELIRPPVVYVDDPVAFAPAVAAVRDVVPDVIAVSRLIGLQATAVNADIGPDTVAKLLFTSGSTGEPKAVVTTHRMLCANQQAIRQVWPFLADEPPVIVDWLPWSHTFGGSHNLNLVLVGGGSLYVDDGRPAPALLERTVANLAEIRPTLVFNVPVGWSLLLPRLQADPDLARAVFARIRVLFFAAAALPQPVWDGLRELAGKYATQPIAVTTSWGATETAPAATSAHFPCDRSDCIGVPLPGVELKLAPVGDKREIRVRGPHVTPGYFDRPDLTRAAFDDDGFYRTGDAVEFIDAANPGLGLRFAGRIAEDFKLDTGTWVNVAAVKAALLSAAGGLLQDCVVTGHDRSEVAAMAWLNPVAAAGLGPSELRARLEGCLAIVNAEAGSSRQVQRLLLLTEAPRLDAGEITDKGYVNQRATLDRRADLVDLLYEDGPHPDVITPPR
jgi:feruloyl-CoA synthase